jgi:hypothetical protein
MHHCQNTDGHANELGATVSLDYCFMTPDEEEEDMRAILIGYDHQKVDFGHCQLRARGPKSRL